MSIRHEVVDILTDGAGAATVYSEPLDGQVLMVRAILGTLASGVVDITITDAASGAAILTITNLAADTDYPVRVTAKDTSGAAITGSFVPVVVSGLVKVVVAAGGAAATGAIHLWVEGC
jgi:membrane-associated protease RseP (regulator of RpoE activity)